MPSSTTSTNYPGKSKNPASASLGLTADSFVGVLIYRSFSGSDYLFSTSSTEGPTHGYFPEEARFGLSATKSADTRPLYRCRVRSTVLSHFLSSDALCEGHISEGILGYMASSKASNLVPLNRYVNLTNNSHIDIVPGDDINLAGWKFEGTHGYVTAIRLPEVTITPDDGQKYFGYYASATDGVGTQDYIPELSAVSNLIFIKSFNNLEQKLIECERLGIKAIVTFDWLFFDQNFHLRSDYIKNFETVEPILRQHISSIAAFYGQDEPYANGFNKKLTVAEIYNAQETMGRFLKSKFPDIPIGVILTVGELRDDHPLFPSFDWFGFDCYDPSLSCGGYSVDWYYNHLDSRLNAMTLKDNKPRFMISVPQAGYAVANSKTGKNDVLAQVPYYRQMVGKYSKVKVVMPFIWQSFNDGISNWVGAREVPILKWAYESFFVDFMNGVI